ncbi:MAG: efflux RND transporter periplasmic adaptor subunit [Betaproteobacteria bacterium]|jgi:membrane fusion protein (multidrug efflux system)|nr:efflux RND transporter periplasmic adaptor subunit [Betaproteobacteria bacterium]MBK7743114.1 efflux RND transporter periplasmic adaptor subunit [Betaproteobacteria bacterium]MBK8688296.1 efflux RND transporter periplasmic adaptor subunit [Betaproteobacteria bacterium]MBK9676805.1 efflux RND transporter periplasmic adaptor subunit [Betaproteobacteria bacterium]MBL0290661.1 efflux RND transporter periplasmic adaptor subunit [Betaproteobacteria bacterium]
MQIPHRSLCRLIAAVGGAALLGSCGSGQPPAAGPGPGAAALPVGIVTAVAQSVPMVTQLPGRTTPYLIAEVRPQVSGIVSRRAFVEGSDVKAGAPLYQIAPASYAAAHDSAVAGLARAEANREAARVKALRHADLIKIEAVSKQAYDDAQAALQLADAEVAVSRAAVDKARIDLDFTRVTAPISGRIGRSAVTAGALVTANQAAPLATIQQLDPIYVDVTQSSTEILRIKRDIDAGRIQRSKDATLPVRLILEDGSEYPLAGRLELSEASVDPGTGSVTLRAVFPNPRRDLLPGMYVRARLTEGSREGAIVLPHAAVSRDPRGNALVMVVNAESKVEARTVEAVQALGDTWVISKGVAAGDRVIVDNLQKIRPGMPVQPVAAAAPGATPPATSAPAATGSSATPASAAAAAPAAAAPAAKTATPGK